MATLTLPRSLALAERYPTNLINPLAAKQNLDDYKDQLAHRRATLFTPDGDSVSVHLCQHDSLDQSTPNSDLHTIALTCGRVFMARVDQSERLERRLVVHWCLC